MPFACYDIFRLMLNEKALKAYLKKKFRGVTRIKIKKLRHGVHGAGFLIEIIKKVWGSDTKIDIIPPPQKRQDRIQ